MNQLDTSPRKYFPKIYDEFVEIDELSKAENELFKIALEKLNALWKNNFVMTCDEAGILKYENLLHITSNTTADSLEFRRERLLNRLSMFPGFTLPWLRAKLDTLLGAGNWDCSIDYERQELIVETHSSSEAWNQEVSVTINQIKPASLTFISRPLQYSAIVMNEEIASAEIHYSNIMGTWALGTKPFAEYSEKEVRKMASTPSIQPELLRHVATFTATDIEFALINDTLLISKERFRIRESSENLVRVEYEVYASEGLGTITNVKLLDALKKPLIETTVAIDNTFNVQLSHKILVEEGINAETT